MALVRAGRPTSCARRRLIRPCATSRGPARLRRRCTSCPTSCWPTAFAAERSVLRLPPAATATRWRWRRRSGATRSCCARRPTGPATSGCGCAGPGVAVAIMPRDWALARAGATVVGSRAAAWAPVRDLAAVVVLDEHDEVVAAGAGTRPGTPGTWPPSAPGGPGCRASSCRPCRRSRPRRWGQLIVPSRAVGARWLAHGRRRRPPRRGSGPGGALLRALVVGAAQRRPGGVRAEPQGPLPAAGVHVVRRGGPLRAVRGLGGALRRRGRSTAARAVPPVRRSAWPAAARPSRTCGPASPGSARSSRPWPRRRWSRSPAPPATFGSTMPGSTSAPRRCCTRSTRPMWWRSSTSTRSCWPPATGPPRRRSASWCGPPASSVGVGARAGCWCRPGCPSTRSSRRR